MALKKSGKHETANGSAPEWNESFGVENPDRQKRALWEMATRLTRKNGQH
jgi:hypothetical protein